MLENIDFDCFANSEVEDSYILSPLYYRITGRKSAWKYQTENAYVVVVQHPHCVNTLMVFPELGHGSYDLTANVLQRLYKSGHDVQLARYSQQNLDMLKRAIAKLSNNVVADIQIVQENILDWCFPVHILDTGKVSALKGGGFNTLRGKCRQASKEVDYKFLDRKTATRDMLAALKFWEGNMIIAEKDTDDMSDFYHEFFEVIENYTGRWDGLMFYQGKRPVGFSVWEVISDTVANSFINLGDTTITGLSDFQRVTVCQILDKKGVKLLNVGGSETENLDAFKRKFMPCKSLDLLSAKVVYKDFDMPDVRFSKFI